MPLQADKEFPQTLLQDQVRRTPKRVKGELVALIKGIHGVARLKDVKCDSRYAEQAPACRYWRTAFLKDMLSLHWAAQRLA